jgi:hypothetical protein
MSDNDQNGQPENRLGINLEAVSCPQCSERMPFIRTPDSVSQLLWGGWTCPACGCKMDTGGKAIDATGGS